MCQVQSQDVRESFNPCISKLLFLFFYFCSEIALGVFLYNDFDNCFKKYILFLHFSLCYGHMCCHASAFPPKKSCVRVSFNINFFLFSVCSIISVIPKVVVDMWHIHALLEGMLHSDSQVNFRGYSSASQAIQFNKTSHMHFTGTFTNISNSNRGVHYTKRR